MHRQTRITNLGLTLVLNNTGLRLLVLTLLLLLSALVSLIGLDLTIYPVEPAAELRRIAMGFVALVQQPLAFELSMILKTFGHTIAFALLAVAVSTLAGLLLATIYEWPLVALFCASIRSVHELFWGLIFLQLYGLSATTGVLAIAVPYCGIFARVFADFLQQQTATPVQSLSPDCDRISAFGYTRLAQAWPQIRQYIRYRFECGLRSSTILGFIGLPTLGFYLETAFKQGQYHEAATLLVLFYGLIAGIRLWLRPRYLVVYLAAALYLLPVSPAWLGGGSLLTFVTQDIWPTPVLQGQWLDALVWYQQLFVASAWPGLIETLLLSQVALGLTGLIALAVYPLACRQLSGRLASAVGHGVLLVMRSTPEMILAFILLLVLGPSALPAIVALAIHNGGLIGYLMAQQADAVKLRADANLGMNRFSYELTPRLYGGFLGYLCYRWEVILRESAIIGILGITTLGFYVDSAFEDIRFDRAAFLIVIAAMLNMLVDRLSRYLQTKTLSASSRTPLVG